jgi:hypothetical protein
MKISRSLMLSVVVLISLSAVLSGCGTRTGGNLITNRLI